MNYNVKLNLAKLIGAKLAKVSGKPAVIIPVEDNEIFLSEKGGAYLDLAAWYNEEQKYDQLYSLAIKPKGAEKSTYVGSITEIKAKMPELPSADAEVSPF